MLNFLHPRKDLELLRVSNLEGFHNAGGKINIHRDSYMAKTENIKKKNLTKSQYLQMTHGEDFKFFTQRWI